MKEKTKHRLAFDLYLRLGPGRSLEALHRTLEEDPSRIGLKRAPGLSTLEAWSSVFHWQDRLLDLEREAQVQALREMAGRHIKEGLALQQKGVERLQQLPTSKMAANDAIRAVIEGVRLERLARGEPTEHIKEEGALVHGHIDLSSFTNEEVRRLAELADRQAAGAGEEERKQPVTP